MTRFPVYPLLVILLLVIGVYYIFATSNKDGSAQRGSMLSSSDAADAQGSQRNNTSDSSSPDVEPSSNGARRIASVPSRTDRNLLIATICVPGLDESKLANGWIRQRLADVIQAFDIVALQGVRSHSNAWVAELLQTLNTSDRRYDCWLGDRVGRNSQNWEQYGFVYDTKRVIAQANMSYTVDDESADLFLHEPLVASFFARPVSNSVTPFRFTLVNFRVNPADQSRELNYLSRVYHSIKTFEYARSREDDVMLIGNFSVAKSTTGSANRFPGLRPAIMYRVKNQNEPALFDNILMDHDATSEWTDNAGSISIVDFFENQVKSIDADKLTKHSIAWAEFSRAEIINPPSQMARQPDRFIR